MTGMVGLVSKPSGEVMETPIVRSLAEGLAPHGTMARAHASRAETLTVEDREERARSIRRRLAAVLGATRITEEDCGTTEGRTFTADPWERHGFRDRIAGRFVMLDVIHPESGEVMAPAGSYLDADLVEAIDSACVPSVTARWAPSCRARGGVCRKCLGGPGVIGDAVGLEAADAIGALAARLTGRIFHVC
jgi:DNA-directed RNA polymerase subunit beta'